MTGVLPTQEDEVAELIIVSTAGITIIVAIFGIIANIINIIVFVKQGDGEVMNISLIGLAVSDLCGLVANLLYSVSLNPLFIEYQVPVEPLELTYVVAAWPRVCFSRISCWITVFIAFERSVCVVLPLKVKAIVTATRSKVLIVSMFVVVFALVVPVYMVMRLDWKFSPTRNRTLVGLIVLPKFAEYNEIYDIFSMILSFSSFITIVVLTVLLVVKLNQKSKWRSEHGTSGKGENEESTMSKRDSKLVKMVIMLAVILIICFIPSIAAFVLSSWAPNFKIGESNEGIFVALGILAFMMESINGSINIFVYHSMSSKFRITLFRILPCLNRNRDALEG